LKKFINNGSIFRIRGDGKRVPITIPKIDIPHIVYGDNGEGVGRGKGKPGDVIGKDPDKCKKGSKAGQEEADGVTVNIDMEDILKFLQDELQLPDLKPKPSHTFEDEKIKYNDLSKVGPESLRHNRKTLLQALKRLAARGDMDKLHHLPGFATPVHLITPINQDRRYRQFKVYKQPSSNAVIFFARDGSGSMDATKCDIVSDMSWWMDIWIRRFYKRVERCYIWHDTVAKEVDEKTFYNYRYGGGTTCSSALKLIAKQFENRFPPNKWNIYVFYFTDGENWDGDNKVFVETIQKLMPPNVVNFVGVTQILSYFYQHSLKHAVDESLDKMDNVRTTYIGSEDKGTGQQDMGGWGGVQLTEDQRNEQIKRAIGDLLGKKKSKLSQEKVA
jgi:uncharacterized sporulation protein YeaH/YhbH (DUF444 family)